MNKTEKATKYHQDLIKSLKDPEEACAYLNAALEENDMPEVFLLALRQVMEARSMAQVAEEANLNREKLYKMLFKQGNPVLGSLVSILKSIELKLSVELAEAM